MDTRIYEPVGGGKVTMYYAENFSRVLATADIFVDKELTTATTDEEFMDAFNSGMVLITIDETIYTVESVASPDDGSISIIVNTDTSGAKYTVYYVAEASMVPGAELELTEIFKDRNLTTAVTMSEIVSAVNSGTVMLFHTSGAYEYHTTIRQVKRVGNTVTVIPDIEEQGGSDAPTVGTAYVGASGSITVEGITYTFLLKKDSSSEMGYAFMSSSEVEEVLRKDIVKIFMVTEDPDEYTRIFIGSICINSEGAPFPQAIGIPVGTPTMIIYCAYEDAPTETQGGT